MRSCREDHPERYEEGTREAPSECDHAASDVFVHFWDDENHGREGSSCVVRRVSRPKDEQEEPLPLPVPVQPPFGNDERAHDPACQRATPTGEAVPRDDPTVYTVFDKFHDLTGKEVTLRWGWYGPPDRGFGYRKISGEHGWDPGVRDHIQEALLGRTPWERSQRSLD